ncbi:MAG: UDP-N-acetylmuramoyl-L-alanine--D-glutamate ligase [Luteibaculaceae bacterium]
MNTKGNISILGAGESGLGAALLAKQQGYIPFVSDSKGISTVVKEQLSAAEIRFEENGHSEKVFEAETVIKSPGIPDSASVVQQLIKNNAEVISEIEFAARFVDRQKIVAITGSNGKTTTTALIHHVFTKAGYNAALCGNIGKSFARCVFEGIYTHYIVEVSSFQLDNCNSFAPKIAVITNITPDHLDRYNYELGLYAAAKFRITKFQPEDSFLVFCDADSITMAEIEKHNTKAQKLSFGKTENATNVAYMDQENIFININQIPFSMSIHDLALQGKHNAYNSMAAGIAARIMDIRKEVIRESLSDFQGIEHRLEFVASIHGINFINDSKATNVNSTWYALESINSEVIWIVGGVDKGNDYSELDALVKQKVKAIVCLGADNTKIKEHFKGLVPTIVEANSAHKAVAEAYKLGKKGDTVVLSPCCASFDLFDNYEDRGIQFKRAVKSL